VLKLKKLSFTYERGAICNANATNVPNTLFGGTMQSNLFIYWPLGRYWLWCCFRDGTFRAK